MGTENDRNLFSPSIAESQDHQLSQSRVTFLVTFCDDYIPQSTYTSRLLSNFKLGTRSLNTIQHSTTRPELTQQTYTIHTRRLCFSEKLTLDTQKLVITSCDSNMLSSYFKLRQHIAPIICLESLNGKTTCSGLRKLCNFKIRFSSWPTSISLNPHV